MSPYTLHIETKTGKYRLGEVILPVKVLDDGILNFVALRFLQGHLDGASIPELRELSGWKKLHERGILSRVDRACKRLAAAGYPLLLQPTGRKQKTKGVQLNLGMVGQVTHDLPDLHSFRAWVLGLPEGGLPDGRALETWPAQHSLSLAGRCFEQGRYPESRSFCETVLQTPSCSPSQEVLALVRLAWIENFIGSPDEVLAAMTTLRARYAQHGGDTGSVLSTAARIQFHLQEGRYALRYATLREAEHAYDQARKWIVQGGEPRAWAAYYTGRQLLAWRENLLEQVEELGRYALAYAIQADWIWMQQVQCVHLGGLLHNRFVNLAEDGEALEHEALLQEAIRFLKQAYQICQIENYGGPAENELILARAGRCLWWLTREKQSPYRKQRNRQELDDLAKDEIEVWLREAEKLLKASDYYLDLMYVQLEWAELAYLRGDAKGLEHAFAEAGRLLEEKIPAGLRPFEQEKLEWRLASMQADLKRKQPKPRWR